MCWCAVKKLLTHSLRRRTRLTRVAARIASNQWHTARVMLYCTWRRSGLATRLHGHARLPTHKPNNISISSADAQLTAECPYTLQWAALPPQNCLFPWGIWTPSNMVPWTHPSPKTKWHLDWFIHFCRAHNCDRQTSKRWHLGTIWTRLFRTCWMLFLSPNQSTEDIQSTGANQRKSPITSHYDPFLIHHLTCDRSDAASFTSVPQHQ